MFELVLSSWLDLAIGLVFDDIQSFPTSQGHFSMAKDDSIKDIFIILHECNFVLKENMIC